MALAFIGLGEAPIMGSTSHKLLSYDFYFGEHPCVIFCTFIDHFIDNALM